MIILRQKLYFGLMNVMDVGGLAMESYGIKQGLDQSKQSKQDFQAEHQKNAQIINDLNKVANKKPSTDQQSQNQNNLNYG